MQRLADRVAVVERSVVLTGFGPLGSSPGVGATTRARLQHMLPHWQGAQVAMVECRRQRLPQQRRR